MTTRMHRAYTPLGTPLYWRDEQSGELPHAIEAYLNNRLHGAAIRPDQIEMMLLREN